MSQTIVQLAQSNNLRCRNLADGVGEQACPGGGYALGPGLSIVWQDGPRGKGPDGQLSPANGAFVEDALVAAYQRLVFFQNSRFAHEANEKAIDLILQALNQLDMRAQGRAERGVLGSNQV